MPQDNCANETPSWLTIGYIEEVLQNYKQDKQIKVKELHARLASAKGENYASIMYRASVVYASNETGQDNKRNKISLIIKTELSDKHLNSILQKYEICDHEMQMYRDILPKFKQMITKNNDNKPLRIFPETIFVDYNNNVIILEDLVESGYVMADRSDGLDLIHAKMVLVNLAKFHAASMIANEKQPNIFKNFNTGMFNRKTSGFSPFHLNCLEACANQIAEWGGGYKYYADKLRNMKETLIENAIKVFDSQEGDLVALLHGDLWVNNVMYKYNKDNQPEDVVIVDFQFCCWASPTIDVIYFLNTSLKDNLRANNQDELIQHYYIHLVDELKKYNFKGKIPSLHEFQIQILAKSYYSFVTAVLILPVMMNKTVKGDFHSLIGNDEHAFQFKRELFKNEKFQEILKRILPILDQKGLLDC